jgi:hypothetical protein
MTPAWSRIHKRLHWSSLQLITSQSSAAAERRLGGSAQRFPAQDDAAFILHLSLHSMVTRRRENEGCVSRDSPSRPSRLRVRSMVTRRREDAKRMGGRSAIRDTAIASLESGCMGRDLRRSASNLRRLASNIGRFVTKIDHLVINVDHLVINVDHFVTDLGHFAPKGCSS